MPPPTINGSMSPKDIMRTLETTMQMVELEDVNTTVEDKGSKEVRPFDAKAAGWQEITEGTFVGDKKFGDKNLLEDMPKVPPKAYDIDLSAPTNARDALLENCKNLKEKFIDREGLKGAIANGRQALEKMEDGPQKTALMKQLDALEKQATKVISQREQLTRFLPTEARKVTNLNASPKDIAAMAKRDMKDVAVALRNFEYDLKRTHGKYGKFEKFTSFMSESFTTTRNSFFRAVQNKFMDLKTKLTGRKGFNEMQLMGLTKDQSQKLSSLEIRTADDTYNQFVRDLKAFSQAVGDPSICVAGPQLGDDSATMGDWKADETLKDYATFKEVLGAKTGGSPDYSYGIEDQLTQLFKGMTKGDSGKEFVLSVEGGVAVPIPVASLSATAKYEYTFKVLCNEAGQVRIERCHAGGVKLDAGAGLDQGSVSAHAEVKGGKGSREGFVSPEDAARSLASGKMGALHNYFLNGTGAGVKSLAKLIQTSVTKKPPLSEGKYIVQAKERGLIKDDATVNFRGPNSKFVDDVEFKRFAAGAGVEAKLDLIIKANADASISIQSDIDSQRTQHRSYYNYFTADRKGEAGSTYLKLADEKGIVDNPAKMNDLLSRQPKTENEKKALAGEILGEIKEMLRRENEYSLKLIGGNEKQLPSAEALLATCRLGTIALVALKDKLNSLGLGPNGGLGPEFDKVNGELRDHLQCPRGMALTKAELIEGLYVDRKYAENITTLKFHLGAGIDMVSGGAQELADMVDSKAGQVAISAVGGAISGVLAAPSASAEVRVELPNGKDPRPFRNQPRMTVDISFKGDLTGKAIVGLIQDKFRAAAKKSELTLKEQNIDAKSILKCMIKPTMTAASGALSASDVDAMSTEEAEAEIFKTFSGKTQSNEVFASFKIEDGRLAAVGIGSTMTAAKTYGATIAIAKVALNKAEQTKIISDTIHATPSFDSMVAMCDDYRLMGHDTEWSMFAMDNSAAFMRMAQIVGGVPPKGDANAADDAQRLDRTLASMAKDIEECPRKEQRERLMANFNLFVSAWTVLKDHFASPDAGKPEKTQSVVTKMCAMLEAVNDHYNILESEGGHGGALAADELKNLKTGDVSTDNAFNGAVSFDWKFKR